MPFSLLAIAPDASFYTTHRREIGRQFLIKDLSLFPFGKQTTTHWQRVVDSCPFEKQQFMALVIIYFSLSQNTFKNSVVTPSIPGVLLCLHCLRTAPNSSTVTGAPKSEQLTWGMFKFFRILFSFFKIKIAIFILKEFRIKFANVVKHFFLLKNYGTILKLHFFHCFFNKSPIF